MLQDPVVQYLMADACSGLGDHVMEYPFSMYEYIYYGVPTHRVAQIIAGGRPAQSLSFLCREDWCAYNVLKGNKSLTTTVIFYLFFLAGAAACYVVSG